MIDDIQHPVPKPQAHLDTMRSFEPTHENAQVERPVPTFRTPEEVAELQYTEASRTDTAELPPVATNNTDELLLPAHASGGGRTSRNKPVMLFGKWPVSRKKLLIVIILIIVLLAGGAAAYALSRKSTAPTKATTHTARAAAPPATAPLTSPLTGLPVDSKAKQTLPVIGAMIENSGDARPQSGLKDAGVVYEAIAEAGITRFLALYQENHPANIGPIRSSRPYYLDWAMAFDASYAHVGGSPDALARIKAIGVHDMDQFYNSDSYHRITTRYAPHNVYTSVDQLTQLSESKGWNSSTFTPFTRKADKPYKAPVIDPKTGKPVTGSDTRTAASSIDFSISSDFYSVHYDYDPTTNLYKRSEGGAPHIDADSGAQLSPKVVIALAMPYSLMDDGYHSQYNTQGTGKMYAFQDGAVTTGTWTKGDPASQFVFKDDNGKTIALNAGQTWISVVADTGKVTYK